MYVGRYRQELLQTEFAALTVQAEMVAASVGEAAVATEGVDEPELIAEMAGSIVRRLARTSRTQAQLVKADGTLVVDSRRLAGPGGVVEIDELPPPANQRTFAQNLLESYDHMIGGLSTTLDPDDDDDIELVQQSRETRMALAGETGRAIRRHFGHRAVLSVAVPVQRYKRVLGAVILTPRQPHDRRGGPADPPRYSQSVWHLIADHRRLVDLSRRHDRQAAAPSGIGRRSRAPWPRAPIRHSRIRQSP